jgi:hypothetical protein
MFLISTLIVVCQTAWQVTRPLELIIDEGVLEVYNRALIFLLQVNPPFP